MSKTTHPILDYEIFRVSCGGGTSTHFLMVAERGWQSCIYNGDISTSLDSSIQKIAFLQSWPARMIISIPGFPRYIWGISASKPEQANATRNLMNSKSVNLNDCMQGLGVVQCTVVTIGGSGVEKSICGF